MKITVASRGEHEADLLGIGDGVSLYVGFVRLLPAFLAFGIIRQTTKSFGAATLGHVTFNVIGTCLVVGTR